MSIAADFSPLTTLRILNLNVNNFTTISFNAFDNNTNLVHLELSNNPIKIVPFFSAIAGTFHTFIIINSEISNTTWDQEIHYVYNQEGNLPVFGEVLPFCTEHSWLDCKAG